MQSAGRCQATIGRSEGLIIGVVRFDVHLTASPAPAPGRVAGRRRAADPTGRTARPARLGGQRAIRDPDFALGGSPGLMLCSPPPLSMCSTKRLSIRCSEITWNGRIRSTSPSSSHRGHGAFQLTLSPAGRDDCDTVAQFGFADRRQEHIAGVSLRNPRRNRRSWLRSHQLGGDVCVDEEHTRSPIKRSPEVRASGRAAEVPVPHRQESRNTRG